MRDRTLTVNGLSKVFQWWYVCSYWLSVNSNYYRFSFQHVVVCVVHPLFSFSTQCKFFISRKVRRLWQCRKLRVWIMLLYNCLLVDICNDWLAAWVYCWSKTFCCSMWKDSKPGMLFFSFPFDELCTTKYETFLDFLLLQDI